jgi:hypothetical protein
MAGGEIAPCPAVRLKSPLLKPRAWIWGWLGIEGPYILRSEKNRERRWAVGRKDDFMFDAELEDFKTKIDLRAYAAGQGYQLDAKNSWRGTSVMRHPASDDKVII